MKKSKGFFKIAWISLLGLLLATCQKEDSQTFFNTVPESALSSVVLNTNEMSNDLLDLIFMIETMASDGLLSKGEANSLIVKIKNAIKSIDSGNINAFSGQLNAFITETEDFIDSGIITIEQGQTLTNVAEYVDNSINEDPVITDGLIAFYPFNGTINDGSGKDRYGTFSNISFTTGRDENPNSAASFYGYGSNIILQGLGQTNGSFSIALWYKTIEGGTILSTDNIFIGTDNNYNFLLTSWPTMINNSLGFYNPGGNPVYLDNTWHHAVITHDANESRIITYFDGVVQHNRLNSGYFVGNNQDIYIGQKINMTRFLQVKPYFVGSIDDIYFFNRAINLTEVEQLYYYPH